MKYRLIKREVEAVQYQYGMEPLPLGVFETTHRSSRSGVSHSARFKATESSDSHEVNDGDWIVEYTDGTREVIDGYFFPLEFEPVPDEHALSQVSGDVGACEERTR